MTIDDRWQHLVSELTRLLPFVLDIEYASKLHQETTKLMTPTMTPKQIDAIHEGAVNVRLGVAQILSCLQRLHAQTFDTPHGALGDQLPLRGHGEHQGQQACSDSEPVR